MAVRSAGGSPTRPAAPDARCCCGAVGRSAETLAGVSLVALPELAAADLIFFAVPSPVLPELARELGAHLDGAHYLVHVSRGIVGDELMTLSQVLRSVTPCRRVGALAGPLVAGALESGAPGGGVVASRFPEVHAAVREAIGGKQLRMYSSDDVTGAEFASTAVGLLAMAVAYVQGIGLGPATLAMVAARGMAEGTRIGVQLGGGGRGILALGFPDDPTAPDRWLPRYLEIYASRLARCSRPYAGVDELLARLAEHGIASGIVTNKPEALARQLLDELGWSQRFAVLVGGDTLSVRKPAPEPIWHACAALGLAPEQTAMVGDDLRDIQAGRAAGCAFTVAAAYGYVEQPEAVQRWEADRIVADPSGLAAALLPESGAGKGAC